MKKYVWLVLCLILLCPALALAQETINVYNWGDYIDVEVLDQFEQELSLIHISEPTRPY